ncbi:hypothetical protein JMJ35_008316 [Cladonia borealis]|uniref:Uncharacterized protein n=1 Tax=Cladonia borealis TaxID=184061 RepID=A0AA39QTM0_9LECA|nr:hypothetical protein JMJ35_008316 [Cladonia borealis]
MATATAASSTDQLPLLSPPALDLPSSDSHPPEYYSPRPHLPSHSLSQPTTTTTITQPYQPATTTDHDNDVDTQSLLPPYSPPTTTSYRGHASEAAYLAALRAWAEDKMYSTPQDKCALPGFYGRETMRECIDKNPELGIRFGRGKKRKEGKVEGEGEGVQRDGVVGGEGRTKGRRKSSLGGWLSRKRTA